MRHRCLSWVFPVLLAPAAAAQIGTESDAAIEKCLLEAELVKKTANLHGVTRPIQVRVECGDATRQAVFKSLDKFHRGLTQFDEGGWEVNFSDSYRYERAAYLLDRELGLNLVPVAVIRTVKRTDGALIDWIDAPHEYEAEGRPTPQQMAALARQKSTMRLFDALIYNIDRNQTNWLVDREDWHLYLIDHSRSFRELSELPADYLDQRAWLSRHAFERLAAFDIERLTELLGDLLGRAQIEALVARRDRLLEKIQADCEEYGESVIIGD